MPASLTEAREGAYVSQRTKRTAQDATLADLEFARSVFHEIRRRSVLRADHDAFVKAWRPLVRPAMNASSTLTAKISAPLRRAQGVAEQFSKWKVPPRFRRDLADVIALLDRARKRAMTLELSLGGQYESTQEVRQHERGGRPVLWQTNLVEWMVHRKPAFARRPQALRRLFERLEAEGLKIFPSPKAHLRQVRSWLRTAQNRTPES